MNNFKRIMMSGHTQRKEYLHKLYADRQVYISSVSSSMQPVEEEKLFCYKGLNFKFEGTGYRNMEKMIIYVFVPDNYVYFRDNISQKHYAVPYEDYILRMISNPINEMSQKYKNDRKSSREKPDFKLQSVNSVVQRRNGCIYTEEKRSFRIRIHFTAALINDVNLNGKSTFKAVKNIMELICDKLEAIDKTKLQAHINLYNNQMKIRKYLKENGLMAFVGNGSILPRVEETDAPNKNAVQFVSPIEKQIEIELCDGEKICGMAIEKGITVITGGGYSGKSTLLDSLEMGIYNHIQGDGREYVITDESACKIYAEDGRGINNTDISPFFTQIPGNTSVYNFSTPRASGSVSQAANIIEAVCGKCRLLMIDEDTSATNFMIRDKIIRKLVRKEPIIPFIDRIKELKGMGISTILVIGGSGEYLRYADSVILMEDYTAKDMTEYVEKNIKSLLIAEKEAEQHVCENYSWMQEIKKDFGESDKDFFYGECVQIDNARYIKINDYTADITKITSVVSNEQINSLTYLLEKILENAHNDIDLYVLCKRLTDDLFDISKEAILSNSHKYELWLEEVRCVDLLMTVCRIRKRDLV